MPAAVLGPALPTVRDLLVLAQGPGVDLGSVSFQEITLRCPFRSGGVRAVLCWHPLYRGGVQVVTEGDRESVVSIAEAIALVRSHHAQVRWQALVNLQVARGCEWRARQARRPQPADLRGEGKRSSRQPHPAAWDTAAFPAT